jgi:DNA-binding transcriptional regulator PaaX
MSTPGALVQKLWNYSPINQAYRSLSSRRRTTIIPSVPEFQQVTLKVLRWEERDKRLVIKESPR